MPAKGSIGKYYGRHVFMSKELWKEYVKETGSTVSYKDFKKVFVASMEETQKWVLREPVGFRLLYQLGNIAVNRMRTYGDFVTYTRLKTSEGRAIKGHNLHTGGDTFRIQWFHTTRSHKDRVTFWYLDAERKFKRALAKVLKSGTYPLYNTYMQDQFVITK